ncbi:MAG: glycoside hydrolase family 38 C-terminal domain-containing protein [Promethearchaeia archaeon]
MDSKEIIITPESHWDREWYLPFQEYRARLVQMLDDLLEIFDTDTDYSNFTLDGQTIPLEDYLEVRPTKKGKIKNYVEKGRLSVGPMYILPDEFLVSGESLIRNLLIGHKIAQRFGKVMKAGYIPDPFGHIAQLPQIISGFEIPSILFWRGLGNEYDEQNLNMEFIWEAPGKASSTTAIFLAKGYGSVADLSTKKYDGKYKKAIRKIRRTVKSLEKETVTPYTLLNNGSDHHVAQPEIPKIVNQWNEKYPENKLVQRDFEYYVEKVLQADAELKSFQGELRGGKYAHLLSGVFSARMWIKQRNTKIEYLYEKYAEPISTITWLLDKYENFEYPQDYVKTGLKWLIKNHPHDSICGCSIDQVHDEMETRFDWAEQIAEELYKNAFIYLYDLIKFKQKEDNEMVLLVFNPLPWDRTDIVKFNGVSIEQKGGKFTEKIKIINDEGKEVQFQYRYIKEEPRYTRVGNISHQFSFLAKVPACGFKTYYVIPGEESSNTKKKNHEFKITGNSIENIYYKITLVEDGKLNLLDKKSEMLYENICFFEDSGDWGDEYDFSGPNDEQTDKRFTSSDMELENTEILLDGVTQKTLKIDLNFRLPISLSPDRKRRSNTLCDNPIELVITLCKEMKRINFKIKLDNNSKDHRIRAIFPSYIKAKQVYADGHFYVVPRDIKLPEAEYWGQDPLPTNHQKDFVCVQSEDKCFAVLNKGLPEYEPIKKDDGTISVAITLLRCVEWLSRGDLATRGSNAGPGLKTPGAQCQGEHTFEMGLIIENEKNNWLDANIACRGKELNNPLKPIFPRMADTPLRIGDHILLSSLGLLEIFSTPHERKVDPYLPPNVSFLNIDNKNIMLSALKKAEDGDTLIIRCYNLSSEAQSARITFFEKLQIQLAELVNFLEKKPKNPIKAEVKKVTDNLIKIDLQPHVIATLKLKISHL